jgi:hypothetical protein
VAEIHYASGKDVRHPRWGHRFQRVRRALTLWPLKWIASSDGRDELYDLSRDPGESRDLSTARPEAAERLRALLDERLSSGPDHEDAPLAPPVGDEERRELEALGYVES